MVLEQHVEDVAGSSGGHYDPPPLRGSGGKAPGNFHCFDVPACSNSAFMTRFLD